MSDKETEVREIARLHQSPSSVDQHIAEGMVFPEHVAWCVERIDLLQAVADAAAIIEVGKDFCGGQRPEDWIAFHAALAKLREHREGTE